MDWKARLRNKSFYITMFAPTMLFVQLVLKQFGVSITPEQVTPYFQAGLIILAAIGVIVDPTTPGLSDGKVGK